MLPLINGDDGKRSGTKPITRSGEYFAELRKDAWIQSEGWTLGNGEGRRKLNWNERMECSNKLASWMYGAPMSIQPSPKILFK